MTFHLLNHSLPSKWVNGYKLTVFTTQTHKNRRWQQGSLTGIFCCNYNQVHYLSQEKMMQALYLEIKNLIISTLNLDELSPEDIETEAPLFGDGLGLDSIDALELGLAVKNEYGIVLSAESEEMRQHFFSVATLASFIAAQRA